MKLLAIGGHRDGQMIDVPAGNPPVVQCVERDSTTAENFEDAKVFIDIYHRTRLCVSEGGFVDVYVAQGVNAMERLLKNYRPVSETAARSMALEIVEALCNTWPTKGLLQDAGAVACENLRLDCKAIVMENLTR